MKNFFRKYKQIPFEKKIVINTIIGLCLSTVLALGKFVLGLFSDYTLCGIAVYTFAMVLAKTECVLGVKSKKRTFKTRNLLIALFLFFSSLLYIGFSCRTFFYERKIKEYGFFYTVTVAFISFVEFGFALAGILRLGEREHFFRDIKIINFCIAIIAILTTQITILDFQQAVGADIYNAYTGIGVGVFIGICAVYIYFAPRISVIDRGHNVFSLEDMNKNEIVDMNAPTVRIMVSKSKVYGSYVYSAQVRGNIVEGDIVRGSSVWKNMNIFLKILCCILSEILIFVWLAGRLTFFLRSINIPRRLERKMEKNGFTKV